MLRVFFLDLHIPSIANTSPLRVAFAVVLPIIRRSLKPAVILPA